jgi:hypothetical protein
MEGRGDPMLFSKAGDANIAALIVRFCSLDMCTETHQ